MAAIIQVRRWNKEEEGTLGIISKDINQIN